MFAPVRLRYAVARGAPSALVLGAVASGAMFAATPFLIPEISDRFAVSNGSAGYVSVTQVGAFAVANLLLSRTKLAPVGTFRMAAVTLVGVSLASALVGTFGWLLFLRTVAGLAAGAMTWVAWSDAMRRPQAMRGVASAGPVTALLSSPVLAALSGLGDRATFVGLALIAVPAAVAALPAGLVPAQRHVVSRSRSNRVLLAALLLLTTAAASLFVYAAVAAKAVIGLSPLAASLGYSLNAAGGIVGARLAGSHRRPGLWLLTAAPAVYLTIGPGHSLAYFAGMAWWGFAFWMAVPGIMRMLSERSLEPGERAGDAQGLLAFGRAMAPALGGGFVDEGAYGALALLAAGGLATSAVTVMAVQEGREHLPATDPRTHSSSWTGGA